MEAKRELTSVDLAALERELSIYEGAFFDKAYLYDDLVRFKLRHHEHGRVELLVNVRDPKYVRVAAPDHVPSAPERPPDFAMMLRNRLEGSTFAGVEQFEFDRIVELRFERDGDSTSVVAELFGDGNLAVLDATGQVVDSLETVRLKSRTVAPGAQYEFPEARFNPLAVDQAGFVARMRDSDTDVVRTLATRLNFGGLWAEELCTRADVPKTLDIAEVTDDQIAALYREVQALVDTLRDGAFDPRVYYESVEGGGEEYDRRPVDVTPVDAAEHAALESDTFETFNGAIDHYVERLEAVESAVPESSGGGRDRPDFEAEIEKQHRIVEQQESAIEDFDAQAEAEREKAELLYARYDLVDEILSTVREARANDVPWEEIEATFADGADRGIDAAEAVVAVDGSEATVTVDLDDHEVAVDVEMGVEKNADRLYTEAKRIEEKRAGAEEAVANTRAELEAIEARREAWDEGDAGAQDEETEADADEEATEVDWLARASIPVRKSEQWYEEFRWFHTSDDFLVIGGRNADQNEALVAKYLERGDRFFHAQAHGGPATILKATGPSEPTREVEFPESTLVEAAQFAVSYSTVWKDGKFAGDVYAVDHDQVSKTPESGEYLEKGGFAIRGDRTYFDDTPVGVAVGITCEPDTRVIGGPPAAIEPRAETSVALEPGKFAQNDTAKRVYREIRSRFADETFVRKVASPDLIQEFLPPGGSRIVED